MRDKSVFRFKQFSISHHKATMKVGTDAVLLGAWVSVLPAKRMLDVGCGSGVIALMLAQRTQAHVHIDAIDISADDCQVANQNVADSPWATKIRVQHIALQEFKAAPYDLIVSNPPYFSNSFKPPTSKRMQARHTETLSHNDLLTHSSRLLSPAGKLSVILPEPEGQQFIMHAQRTGWYCNRMCYFKTRADKPAERLMVELSFQKETLYPEELILYQNKHDWSDAYLNLTRDFYLKT
ncbi:MAG: methyltransferase [Cyclobacteriaceae bacterium]|nr:methyltransferase [Cyclobacteriaceae bacterium]